MQLIQGLGELHANGIIHRDIKPENLYVTNNFQTLKIGGLYFSKNTLATVPQYQTVLGSYFFMAPELLQNQAYNNQVDLFAAKITIFSVMTGCIPFQSSSKEDQNYNLLIEKRYDDFKSAFSQFNLSEEFWDFFFKGLSLNY